MFSGEIPAELTGMSKLNVLLLDGNRISGPIPTGIYELKFLTELNLSNNQLSGDIPAEMGSLPELTMLDLSHNRLWGSIPPEMGNLKLNHLDLSYNQLSGEIPLQLQNQAYEQSFLFNPGLCSSKAIENLNICAHRSAGPDKLAERSILITLVLGGVMSLTLVVIGLLMCRRRSDGSELPPWKLTSFHQLEFTESNIIRGLTEGSVIGSGGSGQVYRINIGNCAGESVAVKKIWNDRKMDWKMEKTFEAEVKVLSSIRHTNVVKLLCCISGADAMLLVYEYMENGSLDQWLHGRQRTSSDSEPGESLNWQRRLQIAIDAAKGLCYMHHHCTPPVIHRDVKSSNILLDSEFAAKIADFGLARMLVKAGEPVSTSAIAGTFGYMAPECAYSKKINEKMDVYSFGVVLLELTTGKKAQDGGKHDGLAGWAARHWKGNGSLIELIDKELSEDLNYLDDIEAVMSIGIECTNKKAGFRPSMKDVLRNLMDCDRRNVPRNFEVPPLLQMKRWSGRKSLSDASEEGGRH